MKKEKIEEPLFLPGEEWRDIKDYEGLYQVSNLGRVKSLNFRRTKSPKILSPKLTLGYLAAGLTKNNKTVYVKIHRLVAIAFISNPNNYPVINHLDSNKQNNNVFNLQWCTSKQNTQHMIDAGRHGKPYLGKFGNEHSKSKAVLQYDLEGNFIKGWGSASDIERELGFNSGYISSCCNGRFIKGYGFIWKFKN